jgi:hypothetical protein
MEQRARMLHRPSRSPWTIIGGDGGRAAGRLLLDEMQQLGRSQHGRVCEEGRLGHTAAMFRVSQNPAGIVRVGLSRGGASSSAVEPCDRDR